MSSNSINAVRDMLEKTIEHHDAKRALHAGMEACHKAIAAEHESKHALEKAEDDDELESTHHGRLSKINGELAKLHAAGAECHEAEMENCAKCFKATCSNPEDASKIQDAADLAKAMRGSITIPHATTLTEEIFG
jgi:hypothetical protein